MISGRPLRYFLEAGYEGALYPINPNRDRVQGLPAYLDLSSVPGPVEFTVMVVEGLGHHWPGGRGQLKRSLAGQPTDRLDANSAVWEFFQRHVPASAVA